MQYFQLPNIYMKEQLYYIDSTFFIKNKFYFVELSVGLWGVHSLPRIE